MEETRWGDHLMRSLKYVNLLTSEFYDMQVNGRAIVSLKLKSRVFLFKFDEFDM